MFILVRLTQHISSIIMLIVRRTDYTKKLRVVNACNTEKNVKCSVGIIFDRATITDLSPTNTKLHVFTRTLPDTIMAH